MQSTETFKSTETFLQLMSWFSDKEYHNILTVKEIPVQSNKGHIYNYHIREDKDRHLENLVMHLSNSLTTHLLSGADLSDRYKKRESKIYTKGGGVSYALFAPPSGRKEVDACI